MKKLMIFIITLLACSISVNATADTYLRCPDPPTKENILASLENIQKFVDFREEFYVDLDQAVQECKEDKWGGFTVLINPAPERDDCVSFFDTVECEIGWILTRCYHYPKDSKQIEETEEIMAEELEEEVTEEIEENVVVIEETITEKSEEQITVEVIEETTIFEEKPFEDEEIITEKVEEESPQRVFDEIEKVTAKKNEGKTADKEQTKGQINETLIEEEKNTQEEQGKDQTFELRIKTFFKRLFRFLG